MRMFRSSDEACVLTPEELAAEHRQNSGQHPAVFSAPGRVNLLGEHTDYADGFCMPAALNFKTLVAATRRNDSQLVMHSLDYGETATFALADFSVKAAERCKSDGAGWARYCAGVAWSLIRSGVKLDGLELTITGDVPRNAGLSSSASVEVATAFALLWAAGAETAETGLTKIARLCQQAENEYVGAPCGIMDQFVAVHGKAGHALQLDCRSLEYEAVALPADARLVIANSMVKHSVGGGEYGERRAQVEEGTRILQGMFPNVQALRDVTFGQLEAAKGKMPEVVFKRCRHVVTDSARVVEGSEMLRAGNVAGFGLLMLAAHASYRDDFEASCRECDTLVELAMTLPGCYGSRLTGGGFGGCTVSLVDAGGAEEFREKLRQEYRAATGIAADAWVCEAGDGARQLLAASF
jgi:galactokinase